MLSYLFVFVLFQAGSVQPVPAPPGIPVGRGERVSQGSPDTFIEKLPGFGEKLQESYKATDGSYFLAVPFGYDPKKAYPLVLAISPFQDGEFMYLTWMHAIAKHKFFFVCPNNAGNGVPFAERGQRALDALADARKKFKIDGERIFITGFSGGAFMATATVKAFPDVFAGHIPIGGPGLTSDAAEFRSLRTKLGFFLFAGENDALRPSIEMAKRALDAAKQPCEIMIGKGKGHSPPSPQQGLTIYEWFLRRAKG